jgi:filamentous hemagglutinin
MVNKHTLTSFIVVILAIAGYFFFGEQPNPGNQGASPPVSSSPAQSTLLIQNVKIYDLDGRLAYEGDIDLEPELARIERGDRDPHDNDGAIFQNREGRLPQQARGYYHEYVVRTLGISHAGPQRLILGENGEIYYTPDHYESFIKVR